MKMLFFALTIALCQFAQAESPSRSIGKNFLKPDERFLGDWTATKDCEKHPSWSNEISIFKNAKNPKLWETKRGDGTPTPFNVSSEIVELDIEKKLFKTVREVELVESGRTLLLGSIWKPMDAKSRSHGLSIILGTYRLSADGTTLIYEKYGYSSGEENNQFDVSPYSKQFPKNYHCVFERTKK